MEKSSLESSLEMTVVNCQVETDAKIDILVENMEQVAIVGNIMYIKFKNEFRKHSYLTVDTEKNVLSWRRDEFGFGKYPKHTLLRQGRDTMNFVILGRVSSVALAKLIAIVKDIIENNGYTRKSYIKLQGGHMDGSGSGAYGLIVDNTPSNIELITGSENLVHNSAFEKLKRYNYWFSLSAVKDRVLIDFITNKQWQGDINELTESFNLKSRIKNGRVIYYR